MRMKFCHYHYEKTKHPKFYNDACILLAKAKNCAFTSQNEVDIFVHLVTEALEKRKPEKHPSKVLHTKGTDGGQITIWSGSLDDDVARLHYSNIGAFLEYDLEAKDFFDVCERFEKGGSDGK